MGKLGFGHAFIDFILIVWGLELFALCNVYLCFPTRSFMLYNTLGVNHSQGSKHSHDVIYPQLHDICTSCPKLNRLKKLQKFITHCVIVFFQVLLFVHVKRY